MVFHLRSGYNNTFVLYTKILSLLPDLIIDLGIPVFEKLPFLKRQFQVHKALKDICSRFAGYTYG